MSLDKDFLKRKTNITAVVIKDSINGEGQRVTTFELEYPRFIHAELLTSRELSKNSSSSRAIPLNKMLDNVINNMAEPVHWGKNKGGMQASDEEVYFEDALEVWRESASSAITQAERLGVNGIGLHKQIANRVTEAFQMIKVVLTSTGFDNLLNLRLHKDAQPEFVMLAHKIHEALSESTPVLLQEGEWHLPYVKTGKNLDESLYLYATDIDDSGTETDGYEYERVLPLDVAIRYSVASCAAVSYRTEVMTLEKVEKIYDMLINAEVVHASPFEHICTPIRRSVRVQDKLPEVVNDMGYPNTWEKGVTHVRRNGDMCSGNFVGWIQYRHLIDNNTCHNFNYNERINSF